MYDLDKSESVFKRPLEGTCLYHVIYRLSSATYQPFIQKDLAIIPIPKKLQDLGEMVGKVYFLLSFGFA